MLFVQLSLKRWDGYFAVVENAGCQRGVGFSERQHIGDVPYRSGSARGDDGNRQPLRQPGVGVARVAVFRPVVVHRREQNLARSAPLRLGGPGEKLPVGEPAAAVRRHAPPAVCLLCVDRNDDELAAVFRGDVADELRIAHGGAVDRHLVGSGGEQSSRVLDRCDAAADGERNIDALGDAGDQLGECAPAFLRRADVEVDQLVGSLFGVASPQFDRVTHVLQTEKVDPLDGLSVLDVEAGYDAFG